MTRPAKQSVVACAALWVIAAAPSHADDAEARKAWAAAGARWGVSFIQMLGQDSQVQPPAYPQSDQSVALDRLLHSYSERKEHLADTDMGLQATAQFAVDGTAAVLYGTGVGAVPAVIVEVAGSAVVDAWGESLAQKTEQDLQRYLAANKTNIIQATGLSYRELQALPPQEIRDRLSRTDVLGKLNERLPNDQNVRDFAQDLVIDGIKNVQEATLDQLGSQALSLKKTEEGLAEVTEQFIGFRRETVATLDKHEKQINELGASVERLDAAMETINQRLESQGRDQAIMADFVFGRMSPAEKLNALQSGFRAEAFECPGGGAECERAQIKKELIDRYTAEAQTLAIASKIQGTAAALGDLSKIADNLGLKIPGLGKAASLANIASQASSQFVAGNYLGAVAALSGAFGKQRDPDQERFAAIMAQLSIINQKLDVVLENQYKMMKALSALSDQLRETHVAIDERLARMEFETKRISDTVSAEAWKGWMPCFAVYRASIEQGAFDPARGRFRDLEALYGVVETKSQPIRDCLGTAESTLLSPAADRYFGNFLSLQRVRDIPMEFFSRIPAVNTAKYFQPGDLEWYVSNVHDPSVYLLGRWAAANSMTWDDLFVALAFPKATVTAERTPKKSDYLTERGTALLVQRDHSPAETAASLLRTPMLPHGAIDIAQWLRVASRFGDIRKASDGSLLARSDLLTYALQSAGTRSAGESILRELLLVLDTAIANYSLKHSNELAQAALSALHAPVEKPELEVEHARKVAFQLLKLNPTLRANVSMRLLRQKYGAFASTSQRPPIEEGVIRKAWLEAIARDGESTRSGMHLMHSLFGHDMDFRFDEENTLIWPIAVQDKETVWAAVPSPAEIAAGQMHYPPLLEQLMRTRESVIEQLLDYESIRRAAKDLGTQASIVRALAQ